VLASLQLDLENIKAIRGSGGNKIIGTFEKLPKETQGYVSAFSFSHNVLYTNIIKNTALFLRKLLLNILHRILLWLKAIVFKH
jgi:hypothetical protein